MVYYRGNRSGHIQQQNDQTNEMDVLLVWSSSCVIGIRRENVFEGEKEALHDQKANSNWKNCRFQFILLANEALKTLNSSSA